MSLGFFLFSLATFWVAGMLIMAPMAWGMVVNKGDKRPLTSVEKEEITYMIILSWISIAWIISIMLNFAGSEELKKDYEEELRKIREEDERND